jgi:hypothetical protein
MKRKVVGWGILAATFAVAAAVARAQLENSPVQPQLQIPPTGLAVALVGYGTGGSVTTSCMDGTFEMIVVQPGETLQVTVQYSPNSALQIVDLTALDGGVLLPPTIAVADPTPTPMPTPDISPIPSPSPCLTCTGQGPEDVPVPQAGLSLAIRADGTISFTFVVGLEPGLRQISLRVADQEIGLQVWVNDPNNPDSNPPGLTPSLPVNGK